MNRKHVQQAKTNSPGLFSARLAAARNAVKVVEEKWNTRHLNLENADKNPEEECLLCAHDRMHKAEQKLMAVREAMYVLERQRDPIAHFQKTDLNWEIIQHRQRKLSQKYVDGMFAGKNFNIAELQQEFFSLAALEDNAINKYEQARQQFRDYLDIETQEEAADAAESLTPHSAFAPTALPVSAQTIPVPDLFFQLVSATRKTLAEYKITDPKRENTVKKINDHLEKGLLLFREATSTLHFDAIFLIVFKLIKLERDLTQAHHESLKRHRLFQLGRAESTLAKILRKNIIKNPVFLEQAKALDKRSVDDPNFNRLVERLEKSFDPYVIPALAAGAPRSLCDEYFQIHGSDPVERFRFLKKLSKSNQNINEFLDELDKLAKTDLEKENAYLARVHLLGIKRSSDEVKAPRL